MKQKNIFFQFMIAWVGHKGLLFFEDGPLLFEWERGRLGNLHLQKFFFATNCSRARGAIGEQ